MAELLAVIASGMSVVSLAIQITESIKKLKDLYSASQSAPEEIRLAIDEVETLSLILEDIDKSLQQQPFLDPRTKLVLLRCYRLCQNSGMALKNLVDELEESLGKGKKGRVKVVLKREKFEVVRTRLESAKTTLVLANQCYDAAIQRTNWESYEKDMDDIRTTMLQVSRNSMDGTGPGSRELKREKAGTFGIDCDPSGSELGFEYQPSLTQRPPHSRSRRRIRASEQHGMKVFGLVDVVLSSLGDTTMTSMTIALPRWINGRTYQATLRKSYQGWDQSFRTYRTVSYDAQIFHYSMAGDVEGLQRLFGNKLASPFEIDPEGRTPLHYAASYTRPDACRFLIENGADANVRTSWHGKFDECSAGAGHGLYRGCTPPLRRDTYRGYIMYSTPLHLLVAIGGILMRDGRKASSRFHCHSNQSIQKDFQETIELLREKGVCDPFLTDQFGRTALDIYSGPTSSLLWLRQQDQDEIAQMSVKEITGLLCRQICGDWDNYLPLFRAIAPEGWITKDIAQYKIEQGPLKGYTLLYVALFAWREEFLAGGTLKDKLVTGLESLIVELISKESDIHIILDHLPFPHTPLFHLIRKTTYHDLREMNRVVRRWLELLSSAGVDLEEYGKIENILHENKHVDWDFRALMSRCWNTLEITQVRVVSTKDFYIEMENLYFTTALASDFWLGVEGALDQESKAQEIPGAWPDD